MAHYFHIPRSLSKTWRGGHGSSAARADAGAAVPPAAGPRGHESEKAAPPPSAGPSRRHFLGLLGSLCLAGVVKAETGPAETRYVLTERPVAGFRFHAGPGIVHEMTAGDALTLVAEPANVHDRWAVRLEHRGRHIGYLPRDINEPIARLLSQGAPVSCRLTKIDAKAAPWKAAQVEVSIICPPSRARRRS